MEDLKTQNERMALFPGMFSKYDSKEFLATDVMNLKVKKFSLDHIQTTPENHDQSIYHVSSESMLFGACPVEGRRSDLLATLEQRKGIELTNLSIAKLGLDGKYHPSTVA